MVLSTVTSKYSFWYSQYGTNTMHDDATAVFVTIHVFWDITLRLQVCFLDVSKERSVFVSRFRRNVRKQTWRHNVTSLHKKDFDVAHSTNRGRLAAGSVK